VEVIFVLRKNVQATHHGAVVTQSLFIDKSSVDMMEGILTHEFTTVVNNSMIMRVVLSVGTYFDTYFRSRIAIVPGSRWTFKVHLTTTNY
jgi:hypothetical protein